MKRILRFLFFFLIILVLIVLLGPKVDFDDVSPEPLQLKLDIHSVQEFIDTKESEIPGMKAENRAEIIWDDPTLKTKTKYSLVYLHGFSSSHREGFPINVDFAKRYGMNLFLSRNVGCGVEDKDGYKGLQPKDMLDSAKEAIEIASVLGDSIVIMACSTGATYAAYLAQSYDNIAGMIFYSPNIDLFDTRSDLMLGPWGLQLTKYLLGGEYRIVGHNEDRKKYWTNEYHVDGIIAMKGLIKQTMRKEHFEQIAEPVFLGCYYKNEENQDNIVSVPRMRDFYNQISTAPSKKVWAEFPNAGNHVITSSLWSSDVETVKKKTYEFAENVLQLIKKESPQEVVR